MENSRNKQFTCFKLHATLRNMMESYSVLLCPVWNKHEISFVQSPRCICCLPRSQLMAVSLGYQIHVTGLRYSGPINFSFTLFSSAPRA